MKFAELNELSAKQTGLSKRESEQRINDLTALFAKLLSAGKKIEIPDFGRLEVIEKQEYTAIDAATGKRFLYPPELEIIFNER
ncbi:MAG: HU family DNA-binding protein [Dysgonamonadaceae bacterium]|jgi:nucleoid DNA-binding protein|nr:HU family DNA-binding protein [Dysgonamonadaceae bacterium]